MLRKWIPHEAYEPKKIQNDIALIKLSSRRRQARLLAHSETDQLENPGAK